MTIQRKHLAAGTLIGLLALIALGVFALGPLGSAAAQPGGPDAHPTAGCSCLIHLIHIVVDRRRAP